MMTPQILKFVYFPKTQKSTYFEGKSLFSAQIKRQDINIVKTII